MMTLHLDAKDPLARTVVNAIQTGDVPTLKRLLVEHPNLATARIDRHDRSAQSRTLRHIATEWPATRPPTISSAGWKPGARSRQTSSAETEADKIQREGTHVRAR